MTHPLYEPRPVIEWSYVFGLTVEVDGKYWEIHLRENEVVREFSKKHCWTIDTETLTVEISLNDKYLIVNFPDGVVRTVALSETKKPEPTNNLKVKRINEDKLKAIQRSVFQKCLAELSLRFEIDFHPYREDCDRMKVFLNDEEIFDGSTEDLQLPKRYTHNE